MKQLDIVHHKFIGLLILLIGLTIGIVFGVKLSYTTGYEGMLVLVFGMAFLLIVMQFVLFIQILHIADDVKRKKK